jgi:hypothetical protein
MGLPILDRNQVLLGTGFAPISPERTRAGDASERALQHGKRLKRIKEMPTCAAASPIG